MVNILLVVVALHKIQQQQSTQKIATEPISHCVKPTDPGNILIHSYLIQAMDIKLIHNI